MNEKSRGDVGFYKGSPLERLKRPVICFSQDVRDFLRRKNAGWNRKKLAPDALKKPQFWFENTSPRDNFRLSAGLSVIFSARKSIADAEGSIGPGISGLPDWGRSEWEATDRRRIAGLPT